MICSIAVALALFSVLDAAGLPNWVDCEDLRLKTIKIEKVKDWETEIEWSNTLSVNEGIQTDNNLPIGYYAVYAKNNDHYERVTSDDGYIRIDRKGMYLHTKDYKLKETYVVLGVSGEFNGDVFTKTKYVKSAEKCFMTLLIVVIAVVAGLIILCCGLCCFCSRRRRRR